MLLKFKIVVNKWKNVQNKSLDFNLFHILTKAKAVQIRLKIRSHIVVLLFSITTSYLSSLNLIVNISIHLKLYNK